mmetsp:Transcript_121909/g.352035  ORF Transcript_121909/g.352035 Transcript_121909/m.352035 type:complete len:269 (+) Transcript_121909:886-1692(+)
MDEGPRMQPTQHLSELERDVVHLFGHQVESCPLPHVEVLVQRVLRELEDDVADAVRACDLRVVQHADEQVAWPRHLRERLHEARVVSGYAIGDVPTAPLRDLGLRDVGLDILRRMQPLEHVHLVRALTHQPRCVGLVPGLLHVPIALHRYDLARLLVEPLPDDAEASLADDVLMPDLVSAEDQLGLCGLRLFGIIGTHRRRLGVAVLAVVAVVVGPPAAAPPGLFQRLLGFEDPQLHFRLHRLHLELGLDRPQLHFGSGGPLLHLANL